jgi:hypothetical protein
MIVDRRFRGAYCLHHQKPEDSFEHHTRRRENLKSHIFQWSLVLGVYIKVSDRILIWPISDTIRNAGRRQAGCRHPRSLFFVSKQNASPVSPVRSFCSVIPAMLLRLLFHVNIATTGV